MIDQMCHFLGLWGKLQNSVQLQWHPRHLSSPNYPVMISSFKNRVYFESWALTELPGADRDDDTWRRNPWFGVSVRGWESQQIDKTCLHVRWRLSFAFYYRDSVIRLHYHHCHRHRPRQQQGHHSFQHLLENLPVSIPVLPAWEHRTHNTGGVLVRLQGPWDRCVSGVQVRRIGNSDLYVVRGWKERKQAKKKM